VGVLLAGGYYAGNSLNVPSYSGPTSAHFDGRVFGNPDPVSLPGPWKGVQYFFTSTPGPWETWRVNPPADEVLERSDTLRVTFINHATTLIQLNGQNILTDPIYSERASPFSWVGPVRRHAPGIALTELPPIDLVLLSHNHYDHTDLPTLDSLAVSHNPTFVVGLGCSGLLKQNGITNVTELDWDASASFGPLTIYGEKCRHFSGRGLSDQQTTLWMSYVIEGELGRVYFAGDTGYGKQFGAAKARHGGLDLAVLPIGAYNPRWFMQTLHLNPAEAVLAHQELGARHSLGIHFGTFKLSEEGQDDPIRDLTDALDRSKIIASAFRALDPGQAWQIPTTTRGN
jgi:L-ascorbate metabolism protein UlaG (beta-lactamase superfamily)